tara:strand:- start:1173 stop:1418 length:246 start_codon:yes stop_codon:yes gene_type:complete
MAFYIRNGGALWTGETHDLHGFTWTEKTHMSNSVKLEEGDAPVPKIERPLMTSLGHTLEEVEGQLVKVKEKKKPAKKKKAK